MTTCPSTAFANLDAWALKTERRLDAVVKDSTQSVVDIAQQRVPVDTGFLRNSLKSSLNNSTGMTGPASHIMIAASLRAGDTATFEWTASYARYVNDGVMGRPGAHFVEGAVDQWPALVRASVEKAKAAVR